MLPKLPIITKNALNKSCSEFNFLQEKSVGAYVYLLQEWSYGARKIAMFEIL